MSDNGAIAFMAAIIRQAMTDYRNSKPWQKEHAALRIFFTESPLVRGAGIDGKRLLADLDRERLGKVTRNAK